MSLSGLQRWDYHPGLLLDAGPARLLNLPSFLILICPGNNRRSLGWNLRNRSSRVDFRTMGRQPARETAWINRRTPSHCFRPRVLWPCLCLAIRLRWTHEDRDTDNGRPTHHLPQVPLMHKRHRQPLRQLGLHRSQWRWRWRRGLQREGQCGDAHVPCPA